MNSKELRTRVLRIKFTHSGLKTEPKKDIGGVEAL